MTSEQVMLSLMAATLMLAGCGSFGKQQPAEPLVSPYATRQVWAVAPLNNESGSAHADGLRLADQLAQQLETAAGLHVTSVNRVLAAMDALEMAQVTSPAEAQRLRQTLGVDGLVVGVITAWEPYDPPKLGLAVELYYDERREAVELNLRDLTGAATADQAGQQMMPLGSDGPASVVSGYFDAADPRVRAQMQRYAVQRRGGSSDEPTWRLHQMSMDLYTEFVSYLVSARLLEAESKRLETPAADPAS